MGEFIKINENDTILWANGNVIGEQYFKFEGEDTVYLLFRDYPYKLTEQQKEIFDREFPYWANFFKGRINP